MRQSRFFRRYYYYGRVNALKLHGPLEKWHLENTNEAAATFFSFAHLIPKQFGFCSGLSKLLFDGFSWTSLPSLRAFADTKMESPRKTKPALLLLLALQMNGNDATQQKWSMPFGKIRSIRDNSRYWLMVLLSSRRSHFKRIVVIKRHSFCLQMTLFQ